MKKQYFAWKDGKQAKNGQQEWTEITPKEYREIYENNKSCAVDERRYFAPLPGVETGDIYYCFECDYERYKKYRAEKEQKARKEKACKEDEERYGPIQLLSFDVEFADESGDTYSLHDLVADASASFEEKLVTDIALESALGHLTDEERYVIDSLFLNEKSVSESELARQMGIPRRTLGCRKEKILNKLKKSFASF